MEVERLAWKYPNFIVNLWYFFSNPPLIYPSKIVCFRHYLVSLGLGEFRSNLPNTALGSE